jgi:hypothetical protein
MAELEKKFLGQSWKESCILLGYVATEICASWRYQPWEDEGRSWLIARSNGLFTMLFHVLRYEGHPALWYLLLWGPSHWHVPYLLMTRVGTLIGIAAVYVLLRYSPLPFPVRAVLPFGFWLAFQYSVVFRSYVLFPLLGFVAVALYRSKKLHPIWFATVLGLLANVSIHGSLVAIGFGVAYAWKLWTSHRIQRLSGTTVRAASLGGGIFTLALVFVAICVWLPQNLQWPFTPTFHRLFPEKKQTVSYRHERGQLVRLPGGVLVRTAWLSEPKSSKDEPKTIAEGERHSLSARAAYILGFPVSSFLALALTLEILIGLMLYRQGKMELCLPLFLLIGFFGLVYVKDWHVGLFWVTLLMVVWAGWDETGSGPGRGGQRWVGWMLFTVGALQIPWTISTIRYEQRNLTYPSEALAKYLKTLPAGTTIDGNVLAFTVYPYFDHAVFVDHGDGRFSQPTMDPRDEPVGNMIRYGTNVIILREDTLKDEEADLLSRSGYREGHRFCGGVYFPQNPPQAPVCLGVFEREVQGPD